MKQRQRPKVQEKSKYLQLPGKHSDDSEEETELFVRKKPYRDVPTIEKPIEEGDTLQAISIRYHCPIAELKRLNNIHKENEIYAKPTIKVPLKPFSMALAGVHISGTSSPKETNGVKNNVDIASLQDKLSVKFLNIPDNAQQKAEEEVKQLIFNSNIKSAEKDDSTENVDDNFPSTPNEEVLLLPKSKETVDPIYNRLSWSGVDGDISLRFLFVCVIVLIVVVPLIYVFHIAEHPEQYHHQKHSDQSHHPR